MNNAKQNILTFIKSKNFNKTLGINWYKNAEIDLRSIMDDCAINSKITYFETALICSILSPANSWEQNLNDVKRLLKWYFRDSLDSNKRPTFRTYNQNVEKAKKYLLERETFRNVHSHLDTYQTFNRFTEDWVKREMKALKTLNFYHNLKNPAYINTEQYFTIDRHMLKIAGFDTKQITPKQYNILKEIYSEAWKESKISCLFHEFQAILWANYVFIKRGILHY